MNRLLLSFLAVVASSCVSVPTKFEGAARIPNGPEGCRSICASWSMELAGMVQFGEYSNACVCEVKKTGGTARVGGVAPAVASVVEQMRQMEAQNALDSMGRAMEPPPQAPFIDIPSTPPYFPPPNPQ